MDAVGNGNNDDADSAALREKRTAFMELLRSGVRAKLQSDATPDAADSAQSQGSTAWRALAWRNAYALDPFFQETICGRPLRIKQLLQGELTGFGTGLTVWPAACLLLKHLEHRYTHPEKQDVNLQKSLVVELGSGTGAVGIAAAMLGAQRVVITDVQKLLFLMETNVQTAQELCGGHLHVDVDEYEWGAPPSQRLLHADGKLPDIVLISDCILPRLYPIEPLVDALECLCGPHTTVLISYEPRYYEPFNPKTRFWELLAQKQFTIREIDDDMYHPHYRADDIEVWEARRAI
jgi:protein N-lysine methyltransferase METTL21D